MELSSWLKTDVNTNFPILGLDSFNTFLKVCAEFSSWAVDDIGLANRNNAYKVWTCKIKSDQIKNVKSILERYTSMKLLLHYYNINIVENNQNALYIKLDWEENAWQMSYGITNNKKMYKVGQFQYTITTKLPEHEILKYITDEISDFNPREHFILFKIKQAAYEFNPGYCQIYDPLLINKEITITTHNLGLWDNDIIVAGEAEKYLQIFKDWVCTKKWADKVHLIVRPKKNKGIDFVLQLK